MSFHSRLAVLLYRLAFGVIVVVTLGYYVWTDLASFQPAPLWHDPQPDYYNSLARGFLKGHLYLDSQPSPELLSAKNPYDPKGRPAGSAPHDISLYQGRFYIYFGAAPVVTLLIPFSILVGHDLPLSYAVLVFVVAGYLALLGCFCLIQKRYYPAASFWSILAGIVALGGATVLSAILRRPYIWELAIAAGFAFFILSLWLFLRSLRSSRPTIWTTAAGVALGLAVCSRPTYILTAVAFLVPWWWPKASGSREFTYGMRQIAAAAAACAALVGIALWYNYARFGDILEFGQRYQLSGGIEADAHHFSFRYLGYNLYMYFLAPLRWSQWFPFIKPGPQPGYPAGYGGQEYMFGVLTNLPFCLFAAAAFLKRSEPAGDQSRSAGRQAISGILVAGCAAMLIPLLFFFGVCIRYTIDFFPCLMLLAAVGVLELESLVKPKLAVYGVRLCAWASALFGSFVCAMGVVYFYDPPPHVYPVSYQPVARWLNWPIAELERLRGQTLYGPIELQVIWPDPLPVGRQTLLRAEGSDQRSCEVVAEYLGARKLWATWLRVNPKRSIRPFAPLNRHGVIESPSHWAVSIRAMARESLVG